jgi:hypothetical protein
MYGCRRDACAVRIRSDFLTRVPEPAARRRSRKHQCLFDTQHGVKSDRVAVHAFAVY